MKTMKKGGLLNIMISQFYSLNFYNIASLVSENRTLIIQFSLQWLNS